MEIFYNSGNAPLKFTWKSQGAVDVLDKKTEKTQWYQETLTAQEIQRRIG